jgi:hypothetical protein
MYQHMDIIKSLAALNSNMNQATPKWAGYIRNSALALATISGTILASPIALSAVVIQQLVYCTLAGTILATISQAFTDSSANTVQ